MDKLTTAFCMLIVYLSLISTSYSQIDLTHCDINKIRQEEGDSRNKPLPYINDTASQYRAVIEENDPRTLETQEISEIFDGLANIGLAVTDANGLRTVFYAYYNTDEVLIIEGTRCSKFTILQAIATGAIPFSFTIVNDKLHIATPLNTLLNTIKSDIVYIGSNGRVRNMAVDQWVTCRYNNVTQETSRVTLSYTDPDNWIPAIGANGDKTFSVPVETLEVIKDAATGSIRRTLTSVTQYRYGTFIEEEGYETPEGVYCPGRINTKNVPSIPKSFSFRSQLATAIPLSLDLIGLITNLRETYDMNKNLFRIDYYNKGTPYHEVHDFNTGLRYVMDRYKGSCTIASLADFIDAFSDGINVRLRNPMEFFNLDNANVQYVGLKRVSGINCNVWIGKKLVQGIDTIYEWYFSSEGWIEQETTSVANEQLVLIKQYQKQTIQGPDGKPQIVDDIRSFYIYDFDTTRLDEFDFDISSCSSQIGYKQIFFKLPRSYDSLLRTARVGLRKGVMDAVTTAAGISYTRVSRVELLDEAEDVDGTFVTFRLLDRPSFYGPTNESLKDDTTLSEAIAYLEKRVTSQTLDINVRIDANQTVTIQPLSNSFNTGDNRFDVVVVRQLVQNQGYSGGSVAGFIIGFLLIGLLCGLIVGIVLMIRKVGSGAKLPGPLGFLNPNF